MPKSPSMDGINLHMYPSPFKFESRILRITGTLKDSGLFSKIIIVASWEKGLLVRETLDSTREVWRIDHGVSRDKHGAMWKVAKIVIWTVKSLLALKGKPIACVNPHSVTALPMAVAIKLVNRCPLVYDTHELETESAESRGPRKLLYKAIERLFMPFVDVISVVSDGCAGWYRQRYPSKKVWVVKNFPKACDRRIVRSDIFRKYFALDEKDILFIYQGMIGKWRGIEILLNVFRRVDPSKHIVFMGYGSDEYLGKIAQAGRETPNIHFYPGVDPSQVVQYTSGADVGIALIENSCASYYYSLPNKLLESLSAGSPVIVSDFPDMRSLIDEYDCGWKVEVAEDQVLHLVQNISQADVDRKRVGALRWSQENTWEAEEKTLLAIYDELLPAAVRRPDESTSHASRFISA